MNELLLAFMLMASQLSGLPPTKELPAIAFLPSDQLCIAVDLCDTDFMVAGYYDMETRRLTLPTKWNPSSPRDLGALLHFPSGVGDGAGAGHLQARRRAPRGLDRVREHPWRRDHVPGPVACYGVAAGKAQAT